MREVIDDQVTGDTADVTMHDGTHLRVVLPPYPNFPDMAPKIITLHGLPGRVFERTSSSNFGPQGPNTYQEFVAPEAHVQGA